MKYNHNILYTFLFLFTNALCMEEKAESGRASSCVVVASTDRSRYKQVCEALGSCTFEESSLQRFLQKFASFDPVRDTHRPYLPPGPNLSYATFVRKQFDLIPLPVDFQGKVQQALQDLTDTACAEKQEHFYIFNWSQECQNIVTEALKLTVGPLTHHVDQQGSNCAEGSISSPKYTRRCTYGLQGSSTHIRPTHNKRGVGANHHPNSYW